MFCKQSIIHLRSNSKCLPANQRSDDVRGGQPRQDLLIPMYVNGGLTMSLQDEKISTVIAFPDFYQYVRKRNFFCLFAEHLKAMNPR